MNQYGHYPDTAAINMKAQAADRNSEDYAMPNYGRNAAMGTARSTLSSPEPRPTIGSVADMSNELHARLSMLEEALNNVHQRIGAENGPMAGGEPISGDNGPVDFTAMQLRDAIRRIDNFRTIVDTISARI